MPRAPLLDDEFSTHPSLTTPNSPPQVGPGTPFGSVPPSRDENGRKRYLFGNQFFL
jgi:hypothetical protein